jgi:hypothetical protein
MLLQNRTHRDGTGYVIVEQDGRITGTVIARLIRTDRIGIAFQADLTDVPRAEHATELLRRFLASRAEAT